MIRPAKVFLAVAILLPLVALFAPKGIVILALLAAVLVAARRSVIEAAAGQLRTPIGMLLVLGLGWAAATSIWSPDPVKAVTLSLSLVGLFAAGFVLLGAARSVADAGKKTIATGLMAGGVLFLALVAFELAGGGILIGVVRGDVSPEVFNRGSAILASFMWLFAAVFAARRDNRWGFGFIALSLIALFFLPMFAALLAAVAGLAVFAAVLAAPRPALAVLAIGVAAVILGAPFASLWLFNPENVAAWFPDLPTSWQHRIYLWQFVSQRITEAPVFGWGLDASRAIPGGAAQVTDRLALAAPALPLHPHNAAIQVWLELGLPGIVLMAAGAVIAILTLRKARLDAMPRAAAAAALTTWLVLAMLSFGIWQNWWLVVPWLLVVLFVAWLPGRDAAVSPS